MANRNAIPIFTLTKEDIEPLIILANDCLQKQSIIYNEKFEYDWNSHINSAYFALGGEYPDDESMEHALCYYNNCLEEVKTIITKLSHTDLKKCISDMEQLVKK